LFRHRLFNVLVVAALLIILALTVREVFATALFTSQGTAVAKCQDLPSPYSFRTEIVDGISVPYSEDGPTGVDGGLAQVLTAYRTCSR
jgi:hypothetical protein